MLSTGSVCAFDALSPLAQLVDQDDVNGLIKDRAIADPDTVLNDASSRLGLARQPLEYESEFNALVDTPKGPIVVYLARFPSIDPPFDLAERIGGRFVALAETCGLPPLELDLLRRAYEVIMGEF